MTLHSTDNFSSLTTAQANFQPVNDVAWAIPVGGKTKREILLNAILESLIDGGASPSNIYIFEDDLGRPQGLADPMVDRIGGKWGVSVIRSRISRPEPETGNKFGTYLARHYHFMLDTLFFGHAYGFGSDRKQEDNETNIGRSYLFTVVLEDDLRLAPDTVKYFHHMAKVMNIDPTVYCAAAHQDNAYYAASAPPSKDTVISPSDFHFRRGNHFMAPGWMTSKKVYMERVRPNWLNEEGNYKFSERFHLKNGHWDRFFDSQIGELECIFPEVPRIVHLGAGGFTVEAKAQLELYENLRLSKTDPSVDYGDTKELSLQGYNTNIRRFLLDATLVGVLEEILLYQNQKLKFAVNARDDQDPAWNDILNEYFGLIGVGGYGGWHGYAKLRGVHEGTVFVRWASNLVLLVGSYSPYFKEMIGNLTVRNLKLKSSSMEYMGCYEDGWNRTLPLQLIWYGRKQLITPQKCLLSCILMGYKYSGIQNGEECWCGFHIVGAIKKPETECNHNCDAALAVFSTVDGIQPRETYSKCGGPWRNSIYRVKLTEGLRLPDPFVPPKGMLFIQANPGSSCSSACLHHVLTDEEAQTYEGKSTGFVCVESSLALLTQHCLLLKKMYGCEKCKLPGIDLGMAAPGHLKGSSECLISKGMWLRCETISPDPTFSRACVCQ